jgi:hypothetical protein
MPTVLNALRPSPEAGGDDDDGFSHDDFPTRQTPHGLQEALLALPLPSDSQRGIHETLAPPAPPSEDSTPELASSPSLGPTIAAPLAPLSPLARRIALPAPTPMPMPISPDETAQMPSRPAFTYPPLPPDSSSISQISQISHASYPSAVSRPLIYPTPTSITGAPLPLASSVRFAFLKNFSPNNDPPPSKLITVAAIAFFATLVLSAFIAWVVVLVRH